MMRVLLSLLLSLIWVSSAWAAEKVTRYEVLIKVEQDADFLVTEKINVISEGRQIRRGIFRDLPRFKLDDGAKVPYQYQILSVTRNGKREPFAENSQDNAKQIRIGDPDYFLPRGQHDYVITYEVKNEVRYFKDFDEVYWNAIGTYWNFPIDIAEATISFPQAFTPNELNCFTGRFGSKLSDCSMSRDGQNFRIKALKPLSAREGMSVSIKFDKGIIDPPSQEDKTMLWWFKNGAIALLGLSLMGLFGYYYRAWSKVGRDPQKNPVFARYSPPDGYSPAAVHQIYNRGLQGNKALIASLIHMSVNKHLELDSSKSETVIRYIGENKSGSLAAEQDYLTRALFSKQSIVRLGKSPNTHFTAAYSSFKRMISKKYGEDYYRRNAGSTFIGIALSVASVVAAFTQFYGNNSEYFFITLAALAALNILFLFLMPAPTKKGQNIRTEIEGFKLYLETAEKERLNAQKDVLSGREPPMTKERYEAFLPYAIALDVEKPWTKYFETILPEVAKNYSPGWGSVHGRNYSSIGGINRAIESNLNSGVSSAMPRSSSSSGGGGGGCSGGGGGGGGGGGW